MREKMSDQSLAERFRALRLALSKSQSAFGEPIGVSYAAVSRWEKDDALPPDMAAIALEHVYGVSSKWLLTGEGPMWIPKPAPTEGSAELLSRPLIAGAASCGPGGEIADPGPTALRMPFRKDFLLELLQESGAGSTEDLYVVECSGESMRPTVHPGDMALINTSLELRLQPKRNALYLVRPDPASAEGRIKRVRIDANGQLCFLSDAPGFTPIAVDLDSLPMQSLILGRVCWVARSVVKDERPERNW